MDGVVAALLQRELGAPFAGQRNDAAAATIGL
jgi:hypothetical protein